MSLNEKLKEHILDSIGEGVLTVDKEFRINFVNKAAKRILGLEESEIIGNFCKYVLASSHCFNNCPIASALTSGKGTIGQEIKIAPPGKKSIHLKVNSSVLYDDTGEPIGGILSFHDITELKTIKKELRNINSFQGIIGTSKAMQEIFTLIQEVKNSDAPVLILGESGTGKELVANAIQQTSSRNKNAFIKVNCSVFSENLLPSELFGHVKGAFTDAIRDRKGRFEMAHQGTIFLDEIAEMPLQMQTKILRVLQEGTFERIGESLSRKIDTRIIAATNVDIEKALTENNFREDLYYRLNVIQITIPPLRDRIEDLLPLTKYFIKKFNIVYNKSVTDLTDEALDVLSGYNWPGNIRELENTIEFGMVRATGDKLGKEMLPIRIRKNDFPDATPQYMIKDNNQEKLELLKYLEQAKWNKSKAAELMGVGRTTLWRKMKKFGLIED
ncbi:MAG: sigma-54 interaction domain-containing protein [Rhodothermaceae bacterium]